MQKTRTKTLLTSSLLVLMVLAMMIGIFCVASVPASAATNRAGSYTISGTYNIGDGNKSGYLSDFRIGISTQYFTDDSATVAQTKYNYHTYDWTYFSFYIYANDIDSHTSFKLTRNGSTYTSKSLSGDGSGYLYQGSLSDGDYVLTYVGTYWDGIFSKKTYTFTYRFTVDTTSPSVSLKANGSTISSGSYTNKAIAFSASDSYSSTKIYYRSPSASSYTYTTSSSKSVSATSSNNGWWYFYATDGYQSSSTYSVYLDTVAPVGKVTNSSGTTISNGGYTNKPVKFTATDTGGVSYCQVKNPGSSSWSTYTAGTAMSASTGWYTFRAVDKAGNTSSEYKVYYDATVPYGYLYGGTTSKSSGGYTNASYVKYNAYDSHSGVKNIYVLKPGASSYVAYTNGSQLTAEGKYYFYCVDNSGNQSTVVNITLDRTLPTGTLYGGTTTKSSGSYTNASYVKYVASDSLSGVNSVYVKMPGASYYTSYSSGTQLATEGTYYFYCVDKAGNQSSTVSITLDKTAPRGTLYGGTSVIASGDSTNASYIKFVPSDNISLSTIYVKKPGTTSYATYTSGTQLTTEGTYSFYSVDRAGNTSSVYTVTLDRQIPSAQLYVDGNPISNNSYTNGEHISFECDETCYVKLPDSTSYVEYLSGAEYYKPGKYVFYGVSDAGNSTGYFTIVIDRTTKTVNLSNVTDGKTNGDVTISWTDGDANLYAPIKSVTINGKAYTKGESIHTIDTGVYKIVVTDAAGNTWNTEFASTKKNILTDTLQKEYYEVFDADDEYFSFSSYDNALAFAIERENGYVRTGEWKSASWDTGIAMDTIDSANAVNGTYYIYKKSGNPNEEVAYFTLDRLNAVIEEYAKVGIESYYYWEKTPATIADGENLFSYSDSKNILANSVTLGDNIGALLNGEEFVGTIVESEGKHTLTVFDDWGNACDYNLTIIRNVPEIDYVVGEGSSNTVTFDRTYYFKDKVTVSITDAYDEMAMFSVYDKDGELLKKLSIGETYEISASGTYTVIAVNHAGDSEKFVLIISRNAPEIVMTESEDDKQLSIVIKESVDEESHIQTLEIYKSTDGGTTWTLVEKDDYGTVVSLDTLSYKFRTTGLYKTTLTDEFRTGIDAITAQLDYIQQNPAGTLEGVDNGGYTNGKVSFAWTDEAVVTLTKDGKTIEYASGTELTEDGEYVLTFENFDGYKTTYSFTIDTAAPTIKLEGAENRESVNEDVKVYYTEENLTAELFKNGKSLGEYVSGNPVSSDGAYRILVSDRAGNKVEVEFTIDKTVDFAINVNDNGLSNSVIATANEQVTVTLTKNGNPVEYVLGSAITEPADYVLTLTDQLGNSKTVSFKIVVPVVKSFSHNFDDVEGFAGATVNGEDKRLNYGTLELFEEGTYEVGVIVSGNTYLFKVTVDTTAPTITLDGVEIGGTTSKGVTVSATSETAYLVVTKNGEVIAYALGDVLTAEGSYTVKATDSCGNSAEYTFTIDTTAPTATITGVENGGTTKDAVVISDVSEQVTISVTKDGEAIEYTLGDEITDKGEYKVTITDSYGNSAEYGFTIEPKISGGVIALIIIVSLLAVGGVVVFILKKKQII